MFRSLKSAMLAPLVSSTLLLAPQSRGQTPTAAENYASKCAMCHMPDGKAQILEMNFVEGSWKHGNKVAEIAKAIRDGIPGTAMLPFKEQLSPNEIEALARLVRAFDKRLKPDSGGKQKK
jgi:mono/diheme cytochrome c family protein